MDIIRFFWEMSIEKLFSQIHKNVEILHEISNATAASKNQLQQEIVTELGKRNMMQIFSPNKRIIHAFRSMTGSIASRCHYLKFDTFSAARLLSSHLYQCCKSSFIIHTRFNCFCKSFEQLNESRARVSDSPD